MRVTLTVWTVVILVAAWAFRHDLTGNQIVLTVAFALGIGFSMGRMKPS